MNTTETLPRWQLESIFADGLEGRAYLAARADFETMLAATGTLMDARRVGGRPDAAAMTGELLEALLERFDELFARYADLSAFLTGHTATDAFDDLAQAERSALLPLAARLYSLETRFHGWLAGRDPDALAALGEQAAGHRYTLERAIVGAEHLMGDEAEALAAALDPSSGSAWARLHGNLVSRTTIRRAIAERPEADLVLSELKHLQADPDEAVRRAAFDAELELLGRHELAYAAALNGIKGQVDELARRRGWESPLAQSLFANGIGAASLEAMQQAVVESFPSFRRYLRAKARLLGKDVLGWYDLAAPVEAGAPRRFTWDEAKAFVTDLFGRYSPALAAFAEEAFAGGWIDVPPRKGKRNGAFCMAIPGRGESRVLVNFGGSLDDAFTLAHELGHAYHNHCRFRAGRTYFQALTPMTLAETASIFCETIVLAGMLERSSDGEQLAILGQDLLGTTQLVVDIHSRFLFERRVFAKRRERELSAEELRGVMLAAQADTYGDGLAAGERHPLMWAHKSHYYSSSRSFYNYPYTFGYLFGLGLYAHYQTEPEGFVARYDDLLASTGMADAATLARGFGIDLDDPDFWRASLAIAAARVDRFEALVAEATA